MWELLKDECVLREQNASPFLMTMPLKYCHYFSIQIKLASLLLALSISSQRGKAGHSCAPTSVLCAQEYLAHDILLPLSSFLSNKVFGGTWADYKQNCPDRKKAWTVKPTYLPLHIYPSLNYLHGIPNIWGRKQFRR